MKKVSVLIPYGPHLAGMRVDALAYIRLWLKGDIEFQVVVVHDGQMPHDGNYLAQKASKLSAGDVYEQCVFIMNDASPTVAWHMQRLYRELESVYGGVVAAIEMKWGGDFDILEAK